MAPTVAQCSGVDSGVIFELHRIVLLLVFLLDAAKTSPQTQNTCPLFVCRMKRNMKWAETLQTFRKQTVLTEIYWDLRSKGSGKRGHIVAETLLLMTFPCARKLGNICCGHQMFLNKIRNIFVSWTQNLCPQQMLRARANGETFVSATMCPQQCVLVCQYLKVSVSCRTMIWFYFEDWFKLMSLMLSKCYR